MLFFGSLLNLSLAYFFQEKDVVLTMGSQFLGYRPCCRL